MFNTIDESKDTLKKYEALRDKIRGLTRPTANNTDDYLSNILHQMKF